MVNIDWEYKFKKQLEMNKLLHQKNIELLRRDREMFAVWTTSYPKQEGWYWIKVGFDGFPGMEHFWPNTEGKICAEDIEHNLYGEECFQGYWFSDRPITEPGDM